MAILPFEPMTACAVAFACLTGPAQPATSTFELTMTDSAAHATAVTLTCEPTGGNHPKRDDACRALAAANGDFNQLTKRKQTCTLEYAPVDIKVTGDWRGKPVTYAKKFPNRCAASAESDGVFAF